MKCNINDCDRDAMIDSWSYSLQKFGIVDIPRIIDQPEFQFCTQHAVRFAAIAAVKRGILAADALDKVKVGELRKPAKPVKQPELRRPTKVEPVKHYGTGYDARVLRLAEIKTEMQKPTRSQRDLTEVEEKLYQVQKRMKRIKPKPVSNRAALYQYLQSKGLDPTKVGSW